MSKELTPQKTEVIKLLDDIKGKIIALPNVEKSETAVLEFDIRVKKHGVRLLVTVQLENT